MATGEAPEPKKGDVLIVDVGTRWCRAGVAGQPKPNVVFPAIVGKSNFVEFDENEDEDADKAVPGSEKYVHHIGQDAADKRTELVITSPVNDGIISNWDDLERIWHHAFFSEMSVDLEDHPVIVVESVLQPKNARERVAQMMFENLNVPSLYITSEPVLALHATGRSTGFVILSGSGVTQFVPVVEGHSVVSSMRKIPLAGRHVTEYMQALMEDRGVKFIPNPLIDDVGAQDIGPIVAVYNPPEGGFEENPWGRVQKMAGEGKKDTQSYSRSTEVKPNASVAARKSVSSHHNPINRSSLPVSAFSRSSIASKATKSIPLDFLPQPYDVSKKTVNSCAFEVCREVKEKHCYLSLDFAEEQKKWKANRSEVEQKIQLPGGPDFSLSYERFTAPEVLFQPLLLGQENKGLGGLHLATAHAIRGCEADLREDMYANIVIAGGNMKFTGMAERLTKELKVLAPNTKDINVITPENMEYVAWIGASKVAMEDKDFKTKCASKEEFEEDGPAEVAKKFAD